MNKIIDILSVKGGDDLAFVDLFHEFNGRVYNFFRKKSLDPESAKELTQLSFIRIYQYRSSLSVDHPLEKQVYIIARSVLLNHIRQADRKVVRESNYARVQFADGMAVDPIALTRFEIQDYLDKILAELSPVRKKVLLLKARQGLSNKEIADELSISVKTVENHITKARQQIRLISPDLLMFALLLMVC